MQFYLYMRTDVQIHNIKILKHLLGVNIKLFPRHLMRKVSGDNFRYTSCILLTYTATANTKNTIGAYLACTKPSVGDCFVIGWRLVNTYCELHFRSIQLLPTGYRLKNHRHITSIVCLWSELSIPRTTWPFCFITMNEFRSKLGTHYLQVKW